MAHPSREQLVAYLDDSLSDAETARMEQQLRDSEPLREQLRLVMAERDRGEHSLGAIWRRNRLTCPTREQLGSYLMDVLDPDFQDYIAFHLSQVECPYCEANLTDLKEHAAPQGQRAARRQRYFQSGAGMLRK